MTKTKVKEKVEEVLAYNDDSIDVKDGLSAIREQSLDMYVGGKDTASFHLVKEVLDNSVDEALNGHATQILVEYIEKENKVIIEDDGRGLPTGMNKKLKKPTIEVLFTQLHAGGKFNKDAFKVSGGKNGVGVKATNALSSELLVESFREGYHYTMKFSRGLVVEGLKKVGKTTKRGTKISFVPDTDVLGEFAKLNPEMIKEELDKRAYITAGLRNELKIGKEKFVYQHDNGIEDYLTFLNPKPVTDVVGFDFSDDNNNNYQVVFSYANETGENIKSFVNGIVTSKGTHETGFKTGLTTAMLEFIKTNNLLPKKLENLEIKGDDIREGLYVIINLKHSAPQFRGQVKDEFSNTDVTGILKSKTHEQVSDWLIKNPDVAKKIATRIIAFAKGRKEANSIKDKIVNVNNSSAGLSFSASFHDCESRDIEKNEIVVIEGKSAGGNVNTARDPLIQAVFPLRGKPFNSYGASYAKILANKEFKEFIKVYFGTTDIKNIDYTKIRYGKIIIMADADDDGFHIVCLFLTFLYEHFPQLFEEERVHIALSPLYRVTLKGGKYKYFKNDNEYDKFIIKEISKTYSASIVNDIKDHGTSVSELVVKGKEYVSLFNKICSLYNLDKDVLSLLENHYSVTKSITTQQVIDDLADLELDVEIDNDIIKAEGLFNDMWIKFSITEDLINYVKELSSIFPNVETVFLQHAKTEETEEMYIYDAINTLNESTSYQRYRFKGLGEADPEELEATTVGVKGRDLLKVRVSDVDNADSLTKLFFGNNADLRKKFIDENL